MTISFESPLVKTILLLLAAGLLIYVLAQKGNWGGNKSYDRQYGVNIDNFEGFESSPEFEPGTYSLENFDEDREMTDYFMADEEEMDAFEGDDDMEEFEDEEEDFDADDDYEDFQDDEYEGYNDEEMES